MLTTPDGAPLTVSVPITDRRVEARVWRMNVGRCPVLLLDANVPGNEPEDRELTAKLYQGDSDVRIRQEILLGIGGMRALRAAGVNPSVLHLNEGHSAFALIERLREFREGTDLSFEAALETVRAGAVFTTHTPVAAGHDEFHTRTKLPITWARTWLNPESRQTESRGLAAIRAGIRRRRSA